MSCDPTETCQVCDQAGLPILPLRYAVARGDAAVDEPAPPLQMPFGDGVADIELPGHAHYTLRLLRAGYLYAFNEVRGEWKAYVVNDQAYLLEFDIHQPPPDIGEAQPCARMARSAAGRCIMVPDATRAGALWLGFSDTAWTPAVLERHRHQAYRERHMQRVDVGAWAAAAAPQPHLDTLATLTSRVCEFAFMPPPGSTPGDSALAAGAAANGVTQLRPITIIGRRHPAVDFSLQDFYNFQPAGSTLVAAATAAADGLVPAMMAIGDPVGITADLARLNAVRLREFVSNRNVARPLAVSTAIENIRRAIMEDAENREIYSTERQARNLRYGGFSGPRSRGARGGMALAELIVPALGEQRDALYERMRNPSAEQLEAARASAWEDYTDQYREDVRADWERQWRERMGEFDRTVVLPLARAHVAWMRSTDLCDKLDCSHDQNDAHSGEAFVDSVLLCIQDTQQYQPCFDLYLAWLNATDIQRDNLVLRALAYNQQAVIDRLDSVADGGLQAGSLKTLPWDGLIRGYEEAQSTLADGGYNAAVRLMAAVGGPFAEVAAKAVDGVVGPALVAAGMIARAPVLMVDVTMSKANAVRELTARMTALNPRVGELRDLNRAIEMQLRKARIRGVPVDDTGRFRYLIMADPQVTLDFPGVDADGSPTARRFAENAILTEADRTRLTRLRWRRLMPTSAGMGVVTGILQAVALGKLAKDLDDSMAHDRTENSWRYGAGVTGFAGTLAETVGRWSESAASVGNRYAVHIERTIGRWLRIGGKALGVGAGVVMAVWDGIRGWQELQEDNAVGWLYFGSAAASVGAMIAFSSLGPLLFGAAATGIGVALVVVVIVIAVLIEVFRDNKLQDWLERCYFGEFDPEDRYQGSAVEMEQLKIALRG